MITNFLKIFLNWALYLLVLFVGVALSWEVFLRISLYTNNNPHEVVMFKHVHRRIAKIWNDGYEKKQIFWGPPYHVFLNRGAENKERMDMIHKYSVLPPNGSWNTPNFLRSKEDIPVSSYQVTTNSLGFRNTKNYSKEKSKNVFRIITLGSYPAFGSGVNDHETYSAYLEKYLNESAPKNISFEVWNGGRQGITAISGLARLENELLEYKPDLLIWDFGWVDLYFGEDFVQNKKDSSYSYSWKQRTVQWIWRKLPFLISSRKIYHAINAPFRDELLKDWVHINKRMIEFAKKNNLPVLLLRQRPVIVDFEHYKKFADSDHKIFTIDFKDDYLEQKMIATEDMKKEFWSSKNWLTEGGYTSEDHINDRYYFYVDAIQMSKYAHDHVAKHLKNFIYNEKLVNEK